MSGLLQGKVALITGAAGGIGSAVSRRFAAEGASVILVDIDVHRLKTLYDDISSTGGEVALAAIDLRDIEKIESLALSVKSKFGSLDILVATAAVIGNLDPIQECGIEDWKAVVEANFFANWYLIKYFDSLLKSSDAGRAIFVTSDAVRSISNYSYFGPYVSSKVALDAMVKVYAAETKHSKLCVNMVYPAQVNSNIYSVIFSPKEPGELPSPENMTDKFVELASAECSITGQAFELPLQDA